MNRLATCGAAAIICGALLSSAHAITIDDFSVGGITVSGPNGTATQTGLDPAHVIGGQRDIRDDFVGNQVLIDTTKGRFHFSTTAANRGYYQLMYGLNQPLNADFTTGGDDRIRFRLVDGGEASPAIWLYVNSILPPHSDGPGIGAALTAMHGLGVVEVLYSIFPTVDFSNVSNFAIWDVRVPAGSSYAIDSIETAAPPLAGDYNRDGKVDMSDYGEWQRALGAHVGSGIILGPDGNGDGVVDASDYTIWRDHLGATSSGGNGGNSLATPEPPTIASLAVALCVLVFFNQARQIGRCGDR